MEKNVERKWPAERALSAMRRWRWILDEAFGIPGTKFRFGWDPIIGLIPGLGDLITGIASIFLLVQAFRIGVPHVIKARMILNLLIDIIIGAIPLIGDAFDFVWKSNSLNLALLEKYAGTGARPRMADWVFVLGTVAVVLIILAIPILLLLFLFNALFSRIHGPALWNI